MDRIEVNEQEDMTFVLRYTGTAVDDGTMDVYEVARNMTAFSDYVIVATHHVFGNETVVRADVSGFRKGSFVTDLAFQVAGASAAIWSASPDLGGVFVAVRESLGMLKFLKGKSPASVQYIDDHSVNVSNINGDVTIVNIASLQIALDPKAGKSAETFVGAALQSAGISGIEISAPTETLVQIERDDAHYYQAVDPGSTEVVVRLGLTIESPSFKEGNKWRFWDGASSVTASIQDPIFLQRIDNGEPFRKGDSLLCDVKILQSGQGSNLKLDRVIVKVIDHVQGHEQTDLTGL